MTIKISKKNNRSQLICVRTDGTFAISEMGPELPFHDLAHFVIETRLKLKYGFFGNIEKGYSIEQLSDKEIIKTLGEESVVSEITTGALQSLASGACTIQQFPELVKQQLKMYSVSLKRDLSNEKISAMYIEYVKLMEQWKKLLDGESLKLEFKIEQ